MNFNNAIVKRRSIYDIDKEIDLTDDEVIELIKNCLMHTPSAYNSQSQRIMILLHKEHDLFWNLTKEELRKIVPGDKFFKTEKKIDKFGNGYGTVLFFDDEKVTNDLVERFPLYKKNFIRWADQQNGMLQENVWVALASKNIGASLQHYNEVIEEAVKLKFKVPKSWVLNAQMPFGRIVKDPKEKEFVDIFERLIIKGKL